MLGSGLLFIIWNSHITPERRYYITHVWDRETQRGCVTFLKPHSWSVTRSSLESRSIRLWVHYLSTCSLSFPPLRNNPLRHLRELRKVFNSLKACVRAYMLSHFSHIQLFATPWTVAHQAPLSMGFSRPEYWSGLPCLSPGDLPNPGIESTSLCLWHQQVGFIPLAPSGKPLRSSKAD